MGITSVFSQKKEYFSNIEAIIFDLDGTLLDSMKYWVSKDSSRIPEGSTLDEYMTEKYNTVIDPKPYAMDMLFALHDNEVPFCILSNTGHDISKGALERLGIEEMIAFYLCGDELDTDKTDPKVFLECAERLSLPPEKIAVFEDNPQYALTARKAGFTVVGIYDDSYKDYVPEMRKICTDYVYNFSLLMAQ